MNSTHHSIKIFPKIISYNPKKPHNTDQDIPNAYIVRPASPIFSSPKRTKLRISTKPSITENGFPVKNENSLTYPDILNDTDRVEYYKGAVDALTEAIYTDDCDIRAYFGWSTPFLTFLIITV